MSSILFVHLSIKGCMGCLMNRICNGYLLIIFATNSIRKGT